jgi:hypothetical protein
MNFELKSIAQEAVPGALEKAMRYRLLNEPGEAESICLDVLEIDPDNQQALVILLLAITDRFEKGYEISDTKAQEVLNRLKDDYERAYYHGIHCERKAKARLLRAAPDSRSTAYEWLCEAMSWYEKAEPMRPSGNDEALLRWNACARIIMSNSLSPRPADTMEHFLE